jgi:hypothetical protein
VVQVTANLYGATVLLDGSAVGVTGEQPLTLPEVAAGKHEIVAEKAGHTTARQQITVSAGQTASVNLALQPVSGAASPGPGPAPTSTPAGSATPLDIPPPARPSRTGYRVGFWVTLAAGLISAGGAVKFGMDVSRVNDDLDPLRRFTCTPPMVLECDANNVPKAPRTTAEQMEMTRLIDEGNRAQTLQWVFVGVGAAFGVASGYLFYRGYLDSVESGAPRREANRGLRIFPTAGASAGGVLAEFDF